MNKLRAFLLSALLLIMPMIPFASPAVSAPPDLAGIWQGVLKIGGIELRLVIKVSKTKDEQYTATLDSPDQGAKDIPASLVSFTNGDVKIEVKLISGVYAGKMSDDNTITGEWKQGPATLPLIMKRTDKAPEVPRRPQEPQKPFPYQAEEVTYDNLKAGIKLAGTLTTPQTGGPFPAAILISGSGPQDRDEALLGHKPFLVLADYLTRQGLAVLRFDDRGVGKSTGEFAKATSADFATDVLAGVEYLKTRKEIDSKKIGLIGHSEGGLIAPMVAAQSADAAFIVLMAGPGISGEEILKKVQCPVLAINGEKDLQVPPQENLAAIAQGLKAGGNKKFVIKELAALNHLFQTASTGAPAEYAKIEETISPAALLAMGDWILAQTKK